MGDWGGEGCCAELRPESTDSLAKSTCSRSRSCSSSLMGWKCVSLDTVMLGVEAEDEAETEAEEA